MRIRISTCEKILGIDPLVEEVVDFVEQLQGLLAQGREAVSRGCALGRSLGSRILLAAALMTGLSFLALHRSSSRFAWGKVDRRQQSRAVSPLVYYGSPRLRVHASLANRSEPANLSANDRYLEPPEGRP